MSNQSDKAQRARAYGKWHGLQAKGSRIYRGSTYVSWGWGEAFVKLKPEIEAWEAQGGEQYEVNGMRSAVKRFVEGMEHGTR